MAPPGGHMFYIGLYRENVKKKPSCLKLRGIDLFVLFDSLRPLNNLLVMRDGSSWVEPVLS